MKKKKTKLFSIGPILVGPDPVWVTVGIVAVGVVPIILEKICDHLGLDEYFDGAVRFVHMGVLIGFVAFGLYFLKHIPFL